MVNGVAKATKQSLQLPGELVDVSFRLTKWTQEYNDCGPVFRGIFSGIMLLNTGNSGFFVGRSNRSLPILQVIEVTKSLLSYFPDGRRSHQRDSDS
jgi:hypothetical protein